ncbi:hypothetical protein NSQ20_05620 [Paenibacillus sp. FSL K6-1122]|uniref:hypothetical protein n=1 Tax=Paenibacillus sp. FSL K6-1122 TaxID=2954512 RepID=UPI0030EB5631
MYKLITLLLTAICLVTGCSETDRSVETLKQIERNMEDAQSIKELREENARLQEQLTILQEKAHSKEIRNNLTETLNLTFRLMAAMESGDIAYLESVSSPNVNISKESNIKTILYGGGPYEVPFLKVIHWDEFEFRGYDPKDSDHFMLFIAQLIKTKGSEGNIAYEFSFIRSPEGVWLFDGYVS